MYETGTRGRHRGAVALIGSGRPRVRRDGTELAGSTTVIRVRDSFFLIKQKISMDIMGNKTILEWEVILKRLHVERNKLWDREET